MTVSGCGDAGGDLGGDVARTRGPRSAAARRRRSRSPSARVPRAASSAARRRRRSSPRRPGARPPRARCGPGGRSREPGPAPAASRTWASRFERSSSSRVGHRAVAVADRDDVRARRGHAAHDVRRPAVSSIHPSRNHRAADSCAAPTSRVTPALVDASARDRLEAHELGHASAGGRSPAGWPSRSGRGRPRTRPTGASATLTAARVTSAPRSSVDRAHRQSWSVMPAVAIDANCDSTSLASTSRSRTVAGAVAHVVGEQRLGLEAERSEHADQRRLVGDHLDHELGQPEVHGVDHGLAREPAADAAPAAARGRRPGGPRRRGWTSRAAGRPRPSRRPRRRRRRSRAPCPGAPSAATTSGSSTSSLRNVRSASGMRAKKRLSAASSSGCDRSELHHHSFGSGRSSE